MNHSFKNNETVLVFPTAQEYADRANTLAKILRPLGDKERDLEVGPMYEVEFEDGYRLHTFEDELETPAWQAGQENPDPPDDGGDPSLIDAYFADVRAHAEAMLRRRRT